MLHFEMRHKVSGLAAPLAQLIEISVNIKLKKNAIINYFNSVRFEIMFCHAPPPSSFPSTRGNRKLHTLKSIVDIATQLYECCAAFTYVMLTVNIIKSEKDDGTAAKFEFAAAIGNIQEWSITNPNTNNGAPSPFHPSPFR